MAKIGELFLKEGQYEGNRIISDSWIKASFSEQISVNDDWNYGLQWWTGKTNSAIGQDFPPRLWLARGYGGQMIIVIQDNNAVIVMNGAYSTNVDRTNRSENKLWHLVRNYILPSL